ncbi:MAG: hypothetical protein ACREX8_21400 [Gammaproteobacteria bacterium]
MGTDLKNPRDNAVGRGRAVFISYAHADNSGPDPAARWLDRLLLHLKPLVFEEWIAVATDRDIGLGDDWHAQIQADLNRAGAAVLLVSRPSWRPNTSATTSFRSCCTGPRPKGFGSLR